MEYKIVKTAAGEAAAVDWEKVPEAKISNVCWGYDQPDVEAVAQVCYNADNLFVRLSAREKKIRATHEGLMGMPCEDSCLEFFFSPLGDGRYFNIEYNPNCAMYLGFGTGPDTLCRLLTGDPPYNMFSPKAERTLTGWNITYTVPRAFVTRFFPGFAFEEGVQMKGNFYKCGDLTEKEHYFSWNPMTVDHPCFHYPPDFGTFVFA